MDEMIIDFPGGARVDAHFAGFTVRTDQSPDDGGDASAPTPFSLFLASLATCAGVYVLGFCRNRRIPTEGIRLTQSVERDPVTHLVSNVSIQIHLPAGFPEKYHDALIRSAEQCAVKKHLEHPPKIAVTTVMGETTGATV